MYKVFFYQHKILIGNNKSIQEEFDIVYQYTSLGALASFLFNDIIDSPSQNILIYNDELKVLWKNFKKLFKVKKAAGGIVYNRNNEWLFIKRRGKWDLPKGHIEEGEHKKIAAIREVSEECGITELTIEQKIVKTYHTYRLKKKPVLKPSVWYLMRYDGSSLGTPQLEEDITEIKWVKAEDAPPLLGNTFETIIDVWETCRIKLSQKDLDLSGKELL